MTAVIGKNGVGKSSLFDAFGFLADCLKLGVEEACDERGVGVSTESVPKDATPQLQFDICYRGEAETASITYELAIDKDESGRPYVFRESPSRATAEHDYYYFLYWPLEEE